MLWRIALIIIVAPIATAIATFPLVGEGVIVVLAGYPLLVLGSILCSPVVHLYIRHAHPDRVRQVGLVSLLGFLGGSLFVLIYFYSSPGGMVHTLRAVVQYGAIGAVHALVVWGMYTFGPLRVQRQTGNAESSDPSTST